MAYKRLNYSPDIVTGKGCLEVLQKVEGERFMVVCGGSSMRKAGVLDRIEALLAPRKVVFQEGIAKNPTIDEVRAGIATMQEFKPDTVIAVGGGSSMDAAKAMIVFYEHPELTFETVTPQDLPRKRKTGLICIPSTSGTASEVTASAVITDPKRNIKVPLNCMANKPDLAIVDYELTMSLPASVVAETGMDALTHAVECYLRPDCDDFDLVLAQGAILGIMEWLPRSYKEKSEEARQKMHNMQCVAGLAFTNGGLTMVHGIAHALGGLYNYAHGLANAVVLPYVLEYNKAVPSVAEKLEKLAKLCGVPDFIQAVRDLNKELGIPATVAGMGLDEATYKKDKEALDKSALLGPTRFNPIPMDEESISKVIDACYYGKW